MKSMCAIVIMLCAAACADAAEPSANDRTPVASETAALAVLDAFMSSFSSKDAAAHVATYHFPHYRLAQGTMSFWETPEAALESHTTLFQTLPQTGWDRSRWVHRRIVTSSATKVHVDTRFQRLRKDGSVMGTYDSLYVVIKKDGRWGVKLRSSFL